MICMLHAEVFGETACFCHDRLESDPPNYKNKQGTNQIMGSFLKSVRVVKMNDVLTHPLSGPCPWVWFRIAEANQQITPCPRERREAQKAVINSESSRQTTRYINGGNSCPIPVINRPRSTSFWKISKREAQRQARWKDTLCNEWKLWILPIGESARAGLRPTGERAFLHAVHATVQDTEL